MRVCEREREERKCEHTVIPDVGHNRIGIIVINSEILNEN